MDEKRVIIGHIAALVTILIWGTTFISTKVLLKEFTPVEILFFRFLMGFIALLVACPRRLVLADKKQEILFAGAGLSGVTLYFLMENIALTYSFASNVGVIICIAPFFTAILAHSFLDGEGLTLRFFLGFIAAICGIALISFNGATALKLSPIGDFLAVGAALLWGIYSILTRKISRYGYNTIQATRRIFFYGILFMIPATFIFDFRWCPEGVLEPVYLLNFFFLGLGASAFCFASWTFAVRILGAVKTSTYIYLVPVTTVVTSAFVLHEKITVMAVCGTGLTLVGLLISENKLGLPKKFFQKAS